MIEHDDLFAPLRVFIRLKGAPQKRLYAQGREETGRNAIAENPLRLIGPSQIETVDAQRFKFLEGLTLLAPIAQASRSDPGSVDACVQVPLVNHHQAILVRQ